MKKLSYLMMTVILCIGLVSCGKDGSMGPQGPMGEQGEQGAAGKDGTAVLNGSADPTAGQGKVGDFYINTSSYVLFGPKTDSGWGNGESILGATGAKGEKGDKGEADYVILSGSSSPTNSIGKTGDFYYNTTTKTFYYRTSSWSLITKLANTIQFTKTGVSVGDVVNIDIDLPWEVATNSMVHVYYKASSSSARWYSLPGYITSAYVENTYLQTSFLRNGSYGSYTTRVVIRPILGAYSTPNATIRIVVTEAHEFHTISKHVDFNNYHEVSQYFGLKH